VAFLAGNGIADTPQRCETMSAHQCSKR